MRNWVFIESKEAVDLAISKEISSFISARLLQRYIENIPTWHKLYPWEDVGQGVRVLDPRTFRRGLQKVHLSNSYIIGTINTERIHPKQAVNVVVVVDDDVAERKEDVSVHDRAPDSAASRARENGVARIGRCHSAASTATTSQRPY